MRILPEALDQRMLDRYPSLPKDDKPFTPCEAGWCKSDGVVKGEGFPRLGGTAGNDIAMVVPRNGTLPESDSTGFLSSTENQGKRSKTYYGLLKCKGTIGG